MDANLKVGGIVMLMGVIVFVLTYLIKYPIKKLTNKIKDNHKRIIINKIILLIPFALGLLAQFIFDLIKKQPFDYNKGLTIGLTSISIYATFEKVFFKKSNTEYDQEDGKKIIKTVEDEITKNRFKKDTNKNDAKDIIDKFIKAIE